MEGSKGVMLKMCTGRTEGGEGGREGGGDVEGNRGSVCTSSAEGGRRG